MKVAIVGFATDGRVSAKYFSRRGDTVTICDYDDALDIPAEYARQLGAEYLHGMARFDLIVRSSGIHPSAILKDNPEVADRVTTSVNEFLAACPTTLTIGITGTKGKGTTSTLVTKILEAAGKTVYLGGNIGRSPLDFIDKVSPDDWVVLELSSFQLTDITHSPHIAACLMVVPEHLNWHEDMADYTTAKRRLFEWQNSDDVAIYFANNNRSTEIAAAGEGKKVPYFTLPGAWVDDDAITIDGQAVCSVDELKLLGKHNWQNVCAAVTIVWQAGIRDIVAIRSVLTSFTGLPHRIEFVREVDGVRYYDDSFGTTPETAIVALRAFEQPKVVILGGSNKGASYDELARIVVRSNVRKVVLVGSEGPRLQAALETADFHSFTSVIQGQGKMPEIVKACRDVAQSGDIVLLSTGCASFGMFENYKDRGDQFKQAVQSLT